MKSRLLWELIVLAGQTQACLPARTGAPGEATISVSRGLHHRAYSKITSTGLVEPYFSKTYQALKQIFSFWPPATPCQLEWTYLTISFLQSLQAVEFQNWKPGWFQTDLQLYRCALCSSSAACCMGMGWAFVPRHHWHSRRVLPTHPPPPRVLHFLLALQEGRQVKKVDGWSRSERGRSLVGSGTATFLLGRILSYGKWALS